MASRTSVHRPGLALTWARELEDFVSTGAWSPDGSLVASGSLAGDCVILDGLTGELHRTLARHPMGVLSVAWSSDGRHLVTGGQDGVARIHHLPDGHDIAIGFNGSVACAAWSPTRAHLAIAAGREVRIVDVTGATIDTFSRQTSTVTSVVWSADGALVGVGCYGGVSWYRPAGGGDPAHRFDWKGSILTMTTAPNGKWLAAGNQDNSVHVWELWSGEDMEMTGYPAKVQHLAWDSKSRHLAVGNMEEVTVWDFAGKGPTGTRPKSLTGIDRRVSALSYQHHGPLLASGTADGGLQLWDPYRKKRSLAEAGVDGEVSQLSWRGDDSHLLVGSSTGQVSVHRSPAA